MPQLHVAVVNRLFLIIFRTFSRSSYAGQVKWKHEGYKNNFIQFMRKYKHQMNHMTLNDKIINLKHTRDIIERRPLPHSITRVNEFVFATLGIYSEKIRG